MCLKICNNKRKSFSLTVLTVLPGFNYSDFHTCQPPEYKNLETNPKICKVGAIFISGPFFWISLSSMQ